MSRPLLFAAVVAIATVAPAQSLGAQPVSPPPFQVVARPLPGIEAPADEYFGRYRLSSLSVRNAISDMTIEGNSPLALPLQIERIEAVRSALPQWAQAYPRDPWLPSSMFKFAQFLEAKQAPTLDPLALALFTYLVWAYPHTWYASHAQGALDNFQMAPGLDLLSGPGAGELAPARDVGLRELSIRRHR